MLQCLALDSLSRRTGRIARIILVVDMEGCYLDLVMNRTFLRAHRRDVVDCFQQKVAAEIVANVYVINLPWTLANLFTLCKTFVPAKFLQKVRVLSGDSLRDSSFVKHCGGTEQVAGFFASRKGLAANSSQKAHKELHSLDLWPERDELELVGRLRAKFADEFERRAQTGHDWPCLFSDLALARVLRGNEGYFSESVNWFQKFLDKMAEHQVDHLVSKMTQRLEESGLDRGCTSMLPHASEIEKHFRCVFSARRLTPSGDVIW